ncbi:MAG: hypothetical protein OZSIB_4134 [Candidatus Ozemobacter sibiricus]|jgi:hypothetical protein|uniref:FecR protein domain-containing protein n=1 Tax=Candidatus Ozemobacter sibiricus TaxID=2268124 RepID=A0A367ZQL4_9BACT|nr:MAG: hypothetical protein OZSIB_4134 [Candidatus Ozemobacter sibiricus]
MNCQDVRAELDRLETARAISQEVADHARGCPACQALLQADRRLEASLLVLEQATPQVRLTPRIMAAVAREASTAAAAPAPLSFLDRLVGAIFPVAAGRRWVAVGVALLLLAIVAHQTLVRSPSSIPTPQWEMTLLSFDAERLPREWAARPAGILLPWGEPVDLGPGSLCSLQWPGRATAAIRDGRFVPAAAGFRLERGRATVQVVKTSPATPFTVATPFAEVAVVGTRFTLDLSADRLHVSVAQGRVRVVHPTGTRDLNPGESLAVGATGFVPVELPPLAPGEPASSVSPAVAGSISSTLEEESPGR